MADELAQVIEVEIQGLKLVVTGTIETAKFLLKAIKALSGKIENFSEKWDNFNQERDKRIVENKLEASGRKSFIDLMKLSETQGGMIQAVKVPEQHMDAFMKMCKKSGLRYSKGVNFTESDGMISLFFHQKILSWRLNF